jgi:phosphoribosyl-AMP cyclohydrolase / phosphoribosyl-ATP pyrophosphohydrolase
MNTKNNTMTGSILQPDFSKYADGLVPAIVQDDYTGRVLMLGFMNQAALDQTLVLQKVTFYSRSKQRLWTKGEESGHVLLLKDIRLDCDRDTLLVKAIPQGPVCHTGADTCFEEKNSRIGFLSALEQLIADRRQNPNTQSYTASLFEKGTHKIAQKVGEEAVELVIEALREDEALFKNEAADLLFHYLVLLQAKGFTLQDITAVLEARHNTK